jgi:dihydroflavonol-4-reductase
VAAETRGRVGERYILGNHNVTFREFCTLVADVAGVPPPRLHLPSAVGHPIVLGMQLWSEHVTHREPLTTVKAMAYLERGAYFDAAKARRELGFPCTPLRDSVERAVQFFRA